jgi:hypothetical protein
MDLMPAQVHAVLEVNPKVASDKTVTFLVTAWVCLFIGMTWLNIYLYTLAVVTVTGPRVRASPPS